MASTVKIMQGAGPGEYVEAILTAPDGEPFGTVTAASFDVNGGTWSATFTATAQRIVMRHDLVSGDADALGDLLLVPRYTIGGVSRRAPPFRLMVVPKESF